MQANSPFENITLTPFAPQRPDASYFSLSRRSTYALSPLQTPCSPGSGAMTPSDERTRMLKNYAPDVQQLRKGLFKLNMKPKRSKKSAVPADDKFTTPNYSWDPYPSPNTNSRPRQYSVSSNMTVESDTQEAGLRRGRARLDPADTSYEMKVMPKKEFMKKLSVPSAGRREFASISSVSSDTPTVCDKDYACDKEKIMAHDKRPSVSSGSEQEDQEQYAVPRKSFSVPNAIEEEDPAGSVPRAPSLPYDYAKVHTEIEVVSRTSDEESTTLEDEQFDDEEPPYVPPAFEIVDPAIPMVEPEPAMTTTEVPQASHPWTVPPFNVVERPKPVIHKVRAAIKITLSVAVVLSLLVGYGLKVKIITFGRFSFGMYGLLLTIDFIIQTIAASINRRRVVKLTAASNMTKGVQQLKDKAEGKDIQGEELKLPEVSIAVVGYREDEEAWIACLKSLQAQEFPIKHIIGVVDGNDPADLDMADAFGKAFPEDQRLIVHLPVLLSVMYKEKYWEAIKTLGYANPTRWQYFKMWFTQAPRPGQEVAHEVAWSHVLDYLYTRSTIENWSQYKGICFSQPHGHKRHAMFTSFMVGAYALGTKDAMLTTDSDTYVYPNAVTNLMSLLMSSEKMAGVTGDVRIWNKKDSFLALMSSLRYWFAFNVERACQSAFGCVGCLSGPLGLYRTSDLMSVLGPWILQSFLGKETTFGDDRHLSNRILSLGHKTGYTHLAMCDSDTPAGYVRWVKQQTRWSKSFFREAFWFPKSFAYHDAWLTVETTKQFLYPMILTATVIQMFYRPSYWTRPVIWLSTMFGVALIKSVYGVICMRDPMHFLFGVYGFMYFFGLLPSKLFACFTVGITTWGTSARSKSEFARPESLYSRTTHIGHLVTWYMALSFGLGYFMASTFHNPIFWSLGAIGILPTYQLYHDVIVGESKYWFFVYRKRYRARRAKVADVEKVSVRTAAPSAPSITDSDGPSTVEVHESTVPAIQIFSSDSPYHFEDIPNPFEQEYPSNSSRDSITSDSLFVGGRGPLVDSRRPSEATLFDSSRRPSEVTLQDGLGGRRPIEATSNEEPQKVPATNYRIEVVRRRTVAAIQEEPQDDAKASHHKLASVEDSDSTPATTPGASDLELPTLKKRRSMGRHIPTLKKGWMKRDFSREKSVSVSEDPTPPLPVGVAI